MDSERVANELGDIVRGIRRSEPVTREQIIAWIKDLPADADILAMATTTRAPSGGKNGWFAQVGCDLTCVALCEGYLASKHNPFADVLRRLRFLT